MNETHKGRTRTVILPATPCIELYHKYMRKQFLALILMNRWIEVPYTRARTNTDMNGEFKASKELVLALTSVNRNILKWPILVPGSSDKDQVLYHVWHIRITVTRFKWLVRFDWKVTRIKFSKKNKRKEKINAW